MITRRSLLVGTTTLALGQMLQGCGGASDPRLALYLLKGSIPAQLLKEFEAQPGRHNSLKVTPVASLTELYEDLRVMAGRQEKPSASGLRWPWASAPTVTPADLLTLGDYWLSTAIQQNLIRPLAQEPLEGWDQLPTSLRALATGRSTGELDGSRAIWGAPYRWGTMAIAYRTDEFEPLGWQPTDWADLWRPELARRISLLDNARAVIGLTLKKLGRSLNTTDLAAVPDLSSELDALHRQVKVYSSTAYLQPLITGDVGLAVGWSNDILAVAKRNPRIRAVLPTSGTLLWADLWVAPQPPGEAGSNTSITVPSDRVRQWIEFCWQPDSVIQQSILGTAASPLLAHLDRTLPQEVLDNPLLVPDPAILDRSEFLQPLPGAIAAEYRHRWTTMRRTG